MLIRGIMGFDRERINSRIVQLKNPTCRISPRTIFTINSTTQIRLGTGVAISHGTVIVVEAANSNGSFKDSLLTVGDNTYIGEMNNLRCGGGSIYLGKNGS